MNLFGALIFILGATPVCAATPGRFISIIAGTQLSTRTYVHFYIENEIGQRTGQLPNGHRVSEIPGTRNSYGTEALSNDVTGAPGFESVQFGLTDLPSGQFKLVLVPLATTSYFLRLDITNDNYSSSDNDYEGYAVAGTTIVYNFEFQPTASIPPPVTKTVTLTGLRQSIQAAFKIGQIGDAKFVAKLDKILADAEKALAKKGGKDKDRENKKEAVAKLRKFIKELEKAFKGEKDEDRDEDDDKDDKKHAEKEHNKPAKRFVSETAFKSLKGDAEALIASLDGKPGKGDKDD